MQDVAEAEKRLLDTVDHDRTEYISLLRTQTAQMSSSRQAQLDAFREAKSVGNRLIDEAVAMVGSVEATFRELRHEETQLATSQCSTFDHREALLACRRLAALVGPI